MLSKYEYEKIAEEISDDMIEKDVPMNESVKVVAIKLKLNPEQIKRLSELSNIKAYNKMYDQKEDKTFTFDVADSKQIIDEVYSDEKDNGNNKEQTVEIKDMQPVEFKAEKNPKKPEEDFEVLGDKDELEVSKNTMNSEDASSDTYMDALKVPEKDYSYSENEVEEEDEDEDDDSEDIEASSMDEVDEDDLEKLKKQAMEMNGPVKYELQRRTLLLQDKLVDDIKKTASFFRTSDRNEKFAAFAKHAQIVFGKSELLDTCFNMLKDECKIDTNLDINPGGQKYASADFVAKKQLEDMMSTLDEYYKTAETLSIVADGE